MNINKKRNFGSYGFASKRLRNQEKEGLAKGVSVSSIVAPNTRNYPRILDPAVHLALGTPQPREAYILAKTPFLKNPLFMVPERQSRCIQFAAGRPDRVGSEIPSFLGKL